MSPLPGVLLKFIDEATITVKAGDGGAGSASFYRGPFVPKGGPDGGNGGRGGDVIAVASTQLVTLEDLTLKTSYKADDGRAGAGNKMAGRSAKDIIIGLPVGTLIYDAASGELLADLTEDGEKFVMAKGGRGGRGNVTFATSRNQTPHNVQSGGKGEQRKLKLELKLIADVGIVARTPASPPCSLRSLAPHRASPPTLSAPLLPRWAWSRWTDSIASLWRIFRG